MCSVVQSKIACKCANLNPKKGLSVMVKNMHTLSVFTTFRMATKFVGLQIHLVGSTNEILKRETAVVNQNISDNETITK